MLSLAYVVTAVAAYLIGAFPTGYIVVKKLKGIDIRTIGSGGTGATNVRRVAGNKAAMFVMGIDILKGLLPVVTVRLLFPAEPWLHVLTALMSVVGHSKSVFLGWAGGKSAATGLGEMLGLAWLPALLTGLIAFAVTRVTRYQSVGSITACVCAPVLLYLTGAPVPYAIYAGVAALFVIYMHKGNIVRLIQGTENRI